MKKISFEKWDRKDIYNFFKNIQDPYFGVSFNLDVTKVYEIHKNKNVSFYLMLVWIFTKAINEMEEFHYDLSKEENFIVYHDERFPSFTDKNEANKFKIVTVENNDDIYDFIKKSKEISEKQKVFIDMNLESKPLIYFSCDPWLDLTNFRSEGLLGDKTNTPRLNWGKIKKDGKNLFINLTLEVNHMFIDGATIGLFYKNVNNIIEGL